LRNKENAEDAHDAIARVDDEKDIMGPKIELKDVWFKYPTRDTPVLRGVNMTVSLSEHK
jgi:ABC-type multidrug transport system fused ATPase/permease subunit